MALVGGMKTIILPTGEEKHLFGRNKGQEIRGAALQCILPDGEMDWCPVAALAGGSGYKTLNLEKASLSLSKDEEWLLLNPEEEPFHWGLKTAFHKAVDVDEQRLRGAITIEVEASGWLTTVSPAPLTMTARDRQPEFARGELAIEGVTTPKTFPTLGRKMWWTGKVHWTTPEEVKALELNKDLMKEVMKYLHE